MSDTVMINVDEITANPYQVREVEDPIAVAELAANIEKNTLLQPPTVRRIDTIEREIDNKYQIAFGHTRLAAFKLLASQGKLEYLEIPCFVKDLDDLQMFEMAVAENIKRRDLNPIERARAMHTYMEKFNKTSVETGEFFGCDESTVRGAVRLLGLPEPAQEKLAAGEISVDNARKLLTVQRMAGAEAVMEAVEDLAGEFSDVQTADEIINSKLRNSTKGVEMWAGWRDQEEPLAGGGLWPLNLSKEKFPNEYLPWMTEANAAKALEQEFTHDLREQLSSWIASLNFNPQSGPDLVRNGAPEDDIERLAHLIAPPACTACPYYARMSKSHYCAFAACHKRKVQAWAQAELVRLSTKLDLPAYDPQSHGKQIYPLVKNWDDDGKPQKLFNAKTDVCLEIKISGSNSMYGNKHDFTESYLVQAIVVGKTAQKMMAKKAEKKSADNGQKDHERQWKIERENAEKSESFIEEVAISAFAPAYAGLDNIPALVAIAEPNSTFDPDDEEFKKATKGRKLEILRQHLADYALSYVLDYDIRAKGPIATARHLQGVAKEWGLKLPKDWLDQAEPFLEGLTAYEGRDGESINVSAETSKEQEQE
jgi:ParB/RepB/Spo0J family partition protein